MLFRSREWVRLAAQPLFGPSDRRRLAGLAHLADQAGVGLLAVGDLLHHVPERRPLADVLTSIREGVPLDGAGRRLLPNAERHLRSGEEMARLFRDHPRAVGESVALLERLTFSLDELRYEYPEEDLEGARTPQEALERLTREGARRRWPDGVPETVERALAHEFAIIGELGYAPYFLTVNDIVRFARARGILAQGRGSAANSAVCYCLGITEVDPARGDLLFERFISPERREPPDIDVDFEHERREEVIQYIYGKYGRERTAIAAVVISYRTRSAIRDVGKALAVPERLVEAFAADHFWFDDTLAEGKLQQLASDVGVQLPEHQARHWLALTREIMGFPRHLSQHVGGFVLTQTRLVRLVPVENASMPDRSVIQWDKIGRAHG